MILCKPATPGFFVTLAATGLLAVVCFSVPHFKSVYFLRAAIQQSGVSGSVTFGVLGYCLDFNSNVTCSQPRVGWEFDPNALLGNDLPIQIPNVVVKWITYALATHIAALCLAGISALFGLLAHVREFTMSCFSTCISGFAAAICLVAFIFDLVLFFAVRARVNNINGGSASIGNALWMTLAAWVCLFFAGCAFAFGRCCVSKSSSGRSSKRSKRKNRDQDSDSDAEDGSKFARQSEQMRLDAVKAEADRKRQQATRQEVGLPAFYEYERAPLRPRDEPQYYEEEVEVVVPYSDQSGTTSTRKTRASERSATGTVRSNRAYEPGVPGTRAVDDYFNGTAASVSPGPNTYPPPPQPQSPPQHQPRQPSAHAHAVYSPSRQPSAHTAYSPPQQRDPYLAVAAVGAGYSDNRGYGGDAYAPQQYPPAQPQAQDPYALSSYNPNAATMSPPLPTHYQDHSSSSYVQQGYYGHEQDRSGYDSQQAYNHAAQQMYAQPEPQRAQPPAAGYDPYAHDPYAQAHDPYAQAQDPYAQDPYVQSHAPYAQDPYVQQAHDPYAQRGPSRQPTMPQPFDQLQPQDLPLVTSPSPLHSPVYSPRLVTAGPAGPLSAGVGTSSQPVHPHAHAWEGARSDESAPEAPPPEYELTPGAGPSTAASGYPVEKR